MKTIVWDKATRVSQLRGKTIGVVWVPGERTNAIVAEIESLELIRARINLRKVLWANRDWLYHKRWVEGVFGSQLLILESRAEIEKFKLAMAL